MTKGRPLPVILKFVLPLIIGNIFQQLYNMADTIIVGRFVGSDALAAVGSTGTIMFLIGGFSQGITAGFSVLTAQRFGARDEDGVKISVANGILLSLIFTAVISTFSILGMHSLLKLMNTPENIFQDAYTYIMIISAGIIATIFYNLFSSYLRAVGNSKIPLVFLIISSVLNVILDIVFVVWIPMGVAGAAFATVLAQLLSGIGCLVYAWKILPILQFTKEELRCDRELVKQMLIYGVPTGLQMSIISVSDMTLQAMVNTYGTALIVAYGVCIKVEGVGWQMAEAIGTSLGTFTGQNVGANHLDRVKQGVRCAYLMNAVCYGIFCPVIWFFARPIMEAFTGNPESIRYGVEYMKIFSCFFFVGGILVVYHNILRSAGDVTITVLMGVSEIITRIGCTFLFTAVFGYYGLWWVSPLTWCCAMLVGCVRYYSGKWKKKVQLQRGESIHG